MSTDLFCVAVCAGAFYAVPAASVVEALEDCTPRRVPLAPRWVAGILAHRGDVITVVSLRALLGLARAGGPVPVLVLECFASGERFGLAVDAIEGVSADAEEVPVQASPETPIEIPIFKGALRLSGKLVHRLSTSALAPDSLLDHARENSSGQEEVYADVNCG